MDLFFEFVGYLAGTCLAISFIPQAIQTYKTKDVQGVSLLMYAIFNLGLFSWIVYGFYMNSLQMMLFNTISLCFSLPILVMIIKYRKKS